MTGINYILDYSKIKNKLFKILIIFHNITVFIIFWIRVAKGWKISSKLTILFQLMNDKNIDSQSESILLLRA